MSRHRGGSFKAGLELERAVSRGLNDLGVVHRQTEHRGEEDVHDGLDFIIPRGRGQKPLEIQLTLQAKRLSKLFRFALKALTNTGGRGIRLYIEVVSSHRRSANLDLVGRRVAEAIKLISRRFRDFGEFNLLGVRIHALTAKIEKFDLLEVCGHSLMRVVEAWREARQREYETQEAERLARIAQARAHVMRKRDENTFWRTILNRNTHRSVPVFSGAKTPNLNLRALFMPRRYC